MKTKRATTLTVEIPQLPLTEIFDMVHGFSQEASSRGSNLVMKVKNFFNNRNNRGKVKNYLPIAILAVVVFAVLIVVTRFITGVLSGQTLGSSDSRVEIQGPRAKVSVDKTFVFPLKDESGKQVAELKFFLDDVELRDEIILQGQKAVALKGRTYLIATIKLTNTSNKFIQMKVRNYVRLSVNGNENEWLAAEIHNDPVEIQPASTKQTRLGFPINDNDTNIVLRVGDLEGKKTTIPLNF